MKKTLEIGLKSTEKRTVLPQDTAQTHGSGSLEVYATPAMIAFMEHTAYTSVEPYLPEGQGTVGTWMDAKHLAATPVGAEVICTSELIEIDRKRLRFSIEVSDGAGVIGTAVHDRFIIDNDKFMDKCAHRLD